MNKNKNLVRDMVFIALCAAIISVCTFISMPIGPVSLTLQTFAIALTGYFLGAKNGVLATLVYIFLGLVGLPVFSGFKGGFAVLAGPTGGFIIGFLVMVLLCGLAKRFKKIYIALPLGLAGLVACHILGISWFAISLSSTYSFWQAFLISSAPFLIKDVISVIIAYSLALLLNKAINKR